MDFLRTYTSWAANRTDSFPEYVRDLARHVAVLERVLHDGTRAEAGSAPCFRCAGDLVRKAADPRPCRHAQLGPLAAAHWNEPTFTAQHGLDYLERWHPDVYAAHRSCNQGGRADTYECARCHWRYDETSYWLAVRSQIEAEKERADG